MVLCYSNHRKLNNKESPAQRDEVTCSKARRKRAAEPGMFAFRATHSVGGCCSPCVSNEETGGQSHKAMPGTELVEGRTSGFLGLLAGRPDTFSCSRSPPLHFETHKGPCSRPSSASRPPPRGIQGSAGNATQSGDSSLQLLWVQEQVAPRETLVGWRPGT